MHFEHLFKRLLILDSIALSAHLETIVVDERSCEEVVETKSVGAQSLLNLLHAVCLQVFATHVILIQAYNRSACTFLWIQHTSFYSFQ